MRDVLTVILPIGKGRRVTLDGPIARRLLARGLARPVPTEPETAAIAPPSAAMRPPGRPRRAG